MKIPHFWARRRKLFQASLKPIYFLMWFIIQPKCITLWKAWPQINQTNVFFYLFFRNASSYLKKKDKHISRHNKIYTKKNQIKGINVLLGLTNVCCILFGLLHLLHSKSTLMLDWKYQGTSNRIIFSKSYFLPHRHKDFDSYCDSWYRKGHMQ